MILDLIFDNKDATYVSKVETLKSSSRLNYLVDSAVRAPARDAHVSC